MTKLFVRTKSKVWKKIFDSTTGQQFDVPIGTIIWHFDNETTLNADFANVVWEVADGASVVDASSDYEAAFGSTKPDLIGNMIRGNNVDIQQVDEVVLKEDDTAGPNERLVGQINLRPFVKINHPS